ncbi:FecR family protein [Marinifilum breve]|nr:FecR family protein [Marinifilum breve]
MNKINQLIAKHFAGEISDKEASQLGDWLKASAENEKLFNDLKGEWENLELKSSISDRFRVLNKVKARIEAEEKQDVKVVRNLFNSSWYRIAASVIVLISISAISWDQIQNPFSIINTLGYEVSTCDAGDQKEILLSDGSQVFLNGDSRVKYKKNLAGEERNVYLQGEAFFDVARNEQKPFVIGLKKAEVKVLGTSFNVKAYPEDEKMETSVLTGKVAFKRTEGFLNRNQESMYLVPGEKGVVDRSNKSIDKLHVDNKLDVAWMNKDLHFENTSLLEITRTLYRMYGVNFKFMDGSLKDLKITANFENEKLEEVIKILEMTSEFSYKMENNLVTLGAKGDF